MAEPSPVAALPMYDWPELQPAHDALWSAIAERLDAAGIAAPKRLDRILPPAEVWRRPGLVLSQTCGYPYATRLRGTVRLVATPVYCAPGCDGPLYSSVIVKRSADAGDILADFAGRRVAFNARDSLSGFIALHCEMVTNRLDPRRVDWVETGSHRASVTAVAEGRADLAAIDAVCWQLARDWEPQAVRALTMIGTTPFRPGLPLIASGQRSDDAIAAIRDALSDALADPRTREARMALHLTGIATLAEADYTPIAGLAVDLPERRALSL